MIPLKFLVEITNPQAYLLKQQRNQGVDIINLKYNSLMKTRLILCCWLLLGIWIAGSCAPVLGQDDKTNPSSRPGKHTTAPMLTSSAATTAQVTEKFKAANISPTVKEIVRMSEAGMDLAVIQTYVEKSNTSHSPTAEEIIYLYRHGNPGPIITSLIQRAGQVREETT